MKDNYERIISDLKKKIYKNVYFLHGDEPYYIDLIIDFIKDYVLTEEEKSFNQVVLYGEETDMPTIINTARRFPMMSNQQVVIIKEAHYLKDLDLLTKYLKSPLNSTVLVISYKYRKLDKRTLLYKALNKNKNVELFLSERLRDYQIPDWIDTYLHEHNIKAERNVSHILTEYLGSDLSRIVNELDKLLISLPGGEQKITAADIEKRIGISKDFNNFELQNALGRKDLSKANLIINHFGHNPKDNPIQITMAAIFSFFRKLLIYHFLEDKSRNNVASILRINPFFVSDYEMASRNYSPGKTMQVISMLREFDMKSKGVGNLSSSEGDLLKELIFKILH
ncbi:MAG TPA: DNA polymerase III subunit delta [Bacteroidales bacterium]|nr:DNA polymerase III subunit delta [Bacteroidales bacterium]